MQCFIMVCVKENSSVKAVGLWLHEFLMYAAYLNNLELIIIRINSKTHYGFYILLIFC